MPDPSGPLAELILCRLLVPAAKPPAASVVGAAVKSLFRDPPAPADVKATLAALASAGLVEAKANRLTDAGRARALAHLGVAGVPDKFEWGTVKSKYLVPRALGLTPGSKESVARITGPGKLAARVLKRGLDLPAGTGDTLAAAVEALACRALGFPKATTLKDVREAVTARELEALTGSPSTAKASLERTVLLVGPASTENGPPALDLETFAARVRAAAESCPTGRFGDNKVFISHVWRHLQSDQAVRGLGLDGFKGRLVQANAAQLLTLSRADMPEVQDPADVTESEIKHHNAEYHFILVEAA